MHLSTPRLSKSSNSPHDAPSVVTDPENSLSLSLYLCVCVRVCSRKVWIKNGAFYQLCWCYYSCIFYFEGSWIEISTVWSVQKKRKRNCSECKRYNSVNHVCTMNIQLTAVHVTAKYSAQQSLAFYVLLVGDQDLGRMVLQQSSQLWCATYTKNRHLI